MSAPRIGRPNPAPTFQAGDRVRLKRQFNHRARTEGTATVLENRPRTRRVVVSVDASPTVVREGYHWQQWPIDDIVLVSSPEKAAKATHP